MSKPTDKLQTIAEFLGEKRVDDLKDYVLAELIDYLIRRILMSESVDKIVIDEFVKGNFEPVEEMLKLRKYLDEHKIEWEDKSDEFFCRTHFWIEGNKWSVINGQGTYGGVDICLEPYKNQNLLECWAAPFGEEPSGWLTADDIIKKMEETYKE